MSRSAMELDFFGMEKKLSPPPKPSSFERRRSFRDIQGVVSKINPEVLKTVIANGSFGLNKSGSVPCTPKEDTAFPSLPLHDSTVRQNCDPKKGTETAPMTIFYNGMVAVFDVSPDKAQDILLLAEEEVKKPAESSDSKVTSDQKNILGTLNGGVFSYSKETVVAEVSREEKGEVEYGGTIWMSKQAL
ncbi:Hypothetical predicted protein [Olea europaea subsp. europaea]|uniref:Protein TIFY n=1 Tax=Olea europaea subsp. europaea TaxID=158383 RepID=A0A8S0S676_OLEEU|nr:Hypothetical predicted protein [Olea europaea subsp. europaea]